MLPQCARDTAFFFLDEVQCDQTRFQYSFITEFFLSVETFSACL